MQKIGRATRVLSVSLIAASGLGAWPALAQHPFEGVVEYDVRSGDRSADLVVTSKGTKVRQEVRVAGRDAPTGFQVTDYASGDVTTVMPAKKSYVTSNYKALRESLDHDHATAGDEKLAKTLADFVATDRHETIARRACTVYENKTNGDEICLETGLGQFLAFSGDYGLRMSQGLTSAPSNPVLAQLARRFAEGALVLRARLTGGERPMELTAKRVQIGGVEDALFAIPAGYKKEP